MAIHRGLHYQAGDIQDMPDDGNRYEIIDGELHVTPSPSWAHQAIVAELLFRIYDHVRRHALGHVVTAPLSVILGDKTETQPDIIYVSNERRRVITPSGIVGAPDLVIEVLSPSTAARDRNIKLVAYARAGIAHYWIADPDAPAVEEYRLTSDGYALTARYEPGQAFEPELFPGLRIEVRELFR